MEDTTPVIDEKVPTLSVVVCTRNRAWALSECLKGLRLQHLGRDQMEVIVVDNGSTDNTSGLVTNEASSFPFDIRLILETRTGLSFARNVGLGQARGNFVAYLDDDAVPVTHWARGVIDCLRKANVGCCAGRTVAKWPSRPPRWLHPSYSWLYSIYDLGDAPLVIAPPNYPVGANMAFARAALETVGGFDNTLGRVGNSLSSGEDSDVFLRMWQVGYIGLYEPRALVHHWITPQRVKLLWLCRRSFMQGQTDLALSRRSGSSSTEQRFWTTGNLFRRCQRAAGAAARRIARSLPYGPVCVIGSIAIMCSYGLGLILARDDASEHAPSEALS